MRFAAVIALLALASACGSAQPGSSSSRYGISVDPPAGWDAEVSRGFVRLTHSDIEVVLREYEPSSRGEAANFRDPWPVRLEPADFDRLSNGDEEDAYLTGSSGRLFSVFPRGGAPSREELVELNEAFGSIEVSRGDYYPGAVDAPRFPSRRGWIVGASGRAERRPQGEFVTAWATTATYYKDDPESFPRRTLETLPDDGIVIWVMLSRGGPLTASAHEPAKLPPYRLRDLNGRVGWEGQIRDLPEYVLWSNYGDGYLVDLRAYFGRRDSSPAMRTEADAMIAALEFPDWGPWELD